MWSADVTHDGVLPNSLCIAHNALWWATASGVLYTWRAGQGDDEPTDPVAVAQLGRRVDCMVVSADTSLIAVVSSSSIALLEIQQTQRPTFLRLCDADGLGEAICDEVIITAEEKRRVACRTGDVRSVVFNSDASLAAVCTDSALLLLSKISCSISSYEDGSGPHLESLNCTHLGASTPGCSVSCFTGERDLLVVDDVNHLVLLGCVSTEEDVSDAREGTDLRLTCPPNASRMAVNLHLMVDGHICSRTARVQSLACSHSGTYGENLVVLGLSNGTVQVLNGQTLQMLRTWNVNEAISSAFIRFSDEARVTGSRRRSGESKAESRDRLGIPDTAASTAAPAAVTIFDVCVGAHLITVCTSHGAVYYSRFTFQLESTYTQLLTTPLLQAGAAAAPPTSAFGGVAMRGGPNGRWAYCNMCDGALYFSWRDVDTQHTLDVRAMEEDVASRDIVHARAPLPAAWLDNVSSGSLAHRSSLLPNKLSRKPAKGSGYTDAPWSVQQERKRKARAAAARDRNAQAFGAVSASAVAPKNQLRFQYDFASIFRIGRASLTRMEASSSALSGLHRRAVVASSFSTAGDALITAGGDGRIRQLHFPIARAKGSDGVAGRILAGHAAAVTAIDANLSRQHPLILSAGADGCLRLWSPGVRDTPVTECWMGCSGRKMARSAPENPIVAAQFFYLDRFLLSCAADALELRRNTGVICSSVGTVAPSVTYDCDNVLSQAPLYRFSVGKGHSINSATAVNHFASNLVFLATSEKEVQVLDVATNTVLWREGRTHSRGIYRVATDRTSRYAGADIGSGSAHLFMSASLDSTAALWDVRMAKPVQLFTQHSNSGISSLALEVAPGIGVVAVASQDNAVYMYDLRGGGGGVAVDVLRGFDAYVTSLAWHPLRPFLVAGLSSGDVHILQHAT
ncbi:hypothetical protein, conserved [Leishmania tarentolae]|uniref:Guanine nucleotide-binding protein subunit beta-like protein n=1 Tax=Leishmania tarentolae TaxID=5689 RepID=A0A640KM74_LEITA|nr:hypothetical protein, conserved [Leishmania tarentolae]